MVSSSLAILAPAVKNVEGGEGNGSATLTGLSLHCCTQRKRMVEESLEDKSRPTREGSKFRGIEQTVKVRVVRGGEMVKLNNCNN